uniref:Uncharacterized protein n=1 Tax=Aegilops tauschii subsp. strangulata TaxID=200361 RepID=A0A453MUH7_AEGTS
MQPGGAPSGSSPASSPRPEQPPAPSQQQQQQAQHLGFARNQVSRPWCPLCPTSAAGQGVGIYFSGGGFISAGSRRRHWWGNVPSARARACGRWDLGEKKGGAFIGAGFSCLAATVATASGVRARAVGACPVPIRPSSSIRGVQCGCGLQFHVSCVSGPGFSGDGGPLHLEFALLGFLLGLDCCAIQSWDCSLADLDQPCSSL